MRHSITLAGAAFALRPVVEDDAEFIVKLRTDPILSRFMNDTSADPAAQRAWIGRYFERPGDYFFIVENRFTGAPEGTISIFNLDAEQNTAEWGRWILRSGSLAAAESVSLTYRIGFTEMDLASLHCHTIVDNHHVMNFHKSYGMDIVAELPRHFTIGGRCYDAVRQRITAQDWPAAEARLAPTVAQAARLLARTIRH
jgi:RimJ/RimL family protein N-acetyltransferase